MAEVKFSVVALVDEIKAREGELSDAQREVLLAIGRREKVKGALSAPVAKTHSISEAAIKRELAADSPEALRLLATLEDRFKNTPAHYNTPAFQALRKGISFDAVKAWLTENPERMWKANYMETVMKGKPDFLGNGKGGWKLICLSPESPEGTRDCVYSKKAARRLAARGEAFNGSVEGTMEETGLSPTTEDDWRGMQKVGKFTLDGSMDWIDSFDMVPADDSGENDIGLARNADRDGDHLYVVPDYDADSHDPLRGWRASLKGLEA